uniref:Glycoprotein n=1 Tax=Coptotermes formosanus phenuivirus 1 TaxID=3133454 RepID=A0AAT9JAE5_9VIRU
MSQISVFFVFVLFACMHSSFAMMNCAVKNSTGLCTRCLLEDWIADGVCYEKKTCKTGYLTPDCGCSTVTCADYPTMNHMSLLDQEKLIIELGHKVCDRDEGLIKNSVCSLKPDPNCSNQKKKGPFYILQSGPKTFQVIDANLRIIQKRDATKSYSYQPREAKTAYGEPKFCRSFPDDESCTRNASFSLALKKLRMDFSATVAQLTDGCYLPITSWMSKEMVYYPNKETYVSDGSCAKCWAHCSYEELIVKLGSTVEKKIELCQLGHCRIISSKGEETVTIKRSFSERINSKSVHIVVWGPIGLPHTIKVTCPIDETCNSLDCVFCWPYTANPQCWGAASWIVFIFVTWSVLFIVGLTLVTLKPILSIFKSIACGIWFSLLFVFRINKHLFKLFRGKAKNTINKYQLVLEKAEEKEAPVERYTSRYYDPTFLAIIFLMILFPLALCNPCHSVETQTVKSSSCSEKTSQLVCDVDLRTSIFPKSTDSIYCLSTFTSDGHKISNLHIKVLRVYFLCMKETQFFTFDHTMHYKSIMMCPHASTCYGSWCEEVNDESEVHGLDLDTINAPLRTKCYRGAACAANGCFYCTESCVTISYYPIKKSEKIWEIFRCSSWKMGAKIEIALVTDGQVETKTFSTINNEVVQPFRGISINTKLSYDTVYPKMDKAFLTDGSRVAVVDTASAGAPEPAIIGQIQCAEKSSDFSKCKMAPNLCNCKVSGIEPSCSCPEVNLEKIVIDHKRALPLQDSDLLLTRDGSDIVAEKFGFGNVELVIGTKGDLVAGTLPSRNCKVGKTSISGCYSCGIGARLNYSCITTTPSSYIMTCNVGGKVLIECDDSTKIHHTRILYSSPVIRDECSVPCSMDKVSIVGSLIYTGYDAYNSQRTLILGSVNATTSMWSVSGAWSAFSFISKLFSSIGLLRSSVSIVIIAVIVLIMLYFVRRVINFKLKRH